MLSLLAQKTQLHAEIAACETFKASFQDNKAKWFFLTVKVPADTQTHLKLK